MGAMLLRGRVLAKHVRSLIPCLKNGMRARARADPFSFSDRPKTDAYGQTLGGAVQVQRLGQRGLDKSSVRVGRFPEQCLMGSHGWDFRDFSVSWFSPLLFGW